MKHLLKFDPRHFLAAGLFLILFGCHHIQQLPKNKITQKVPPFNVLFISIDTLRADHLGCFGSSIVKTPNIDQLAKEGALFSKCYTPVPVTLPSHLSMMTGLFPLSHGVRNNGTFLAPPELETLAESFKARGCQTAAFIGSFVLDSRFGLDQGFDYYDDYLSKDQSQPLLLYNERKAEAVVSSAQSWLKEHGQNPFFLWLHCFDPHAPYDPPEPFTTNYRENPYSGEIAYVDQELGKLFATLKEMNLWDKTLIVFTADHGEGLGEHGEKTHAIFIYDSTLRVPLILHYPALLPQNVEITQEVSIIDIYPTLIELAGSKDHGLHQGKSLLGLCRGQDKPLRSQFMCETYYPLYNHGWSPLEGLRTPEWIYIQAPRPELFNRLEDPQQMNNLYSSQPEVAENLKKELENFKIHLTIGQTQSKKVNIDQDTAQRLRSLGYVATVSSAPKQDSNFTLYPDPKDMITTLDFLNTATYYYGQGNIEKAVEQFKTVLTINPNDVFAHFVLGYIYDQQGKTDLAILEFNETLRLDPLYVSAYNDLGTVYNRLGQYDKAIENFEKALELNPEYSEAVENIGVVYFALKEYDKALGYFEKSLTMNPKNHKAYNNIGSVYLAKGNYPKAKELIEKAQELSPDYADAYNNLGSVYIHLGDFDKAIDQFMALLKIKPDHLEGLVNLASASIGKGSFDQALEFLEKARQINPDMPKIFSCFGTIYVRMGKYPEAIEQFQKALTFEISAETHYNLGIAYYQTGQTDQAIKSYEEALKLDPANPACHVNLGIAYLNQQKFDQAIAEYQKALQLDPDNAEAFINLGVVYYHQGKFDLAREIYQKADEIAPNHLQVHVNLGMTYHALGFMDKAEEEYKKGLELSPTCLEALVNLAILYFNTNKYDQALTYYQSAITHHPTNPLGYYGLGYTYLITGEIDKSIEALQKVLQIKPDHLESQALLEKALEIKKAPK